MTAPPARPDGAAAIAVTPAAPRAVAPAVAARAEPLVLSPDRYFDPDPAVRRLARRLYEETRALPIVSPHGHVDPALLAADAPFPEPAALLVAPDHYVFRMLYSRGVPLEALGIRPAGGAGAGAAGAGAAGADPRAAWRAFASHWHLFRGTPTRAWLDYALHELFGVRVRPSAGTADRVYDQVAERLTDAGFRPRALFARFGIEVLATTDAADDDLRHHRAIRASGWGGRVVPTFRPDALFRVAAPGWRAALAGLEAAAGRAVPDYAAFVAALAERRAYFRAFGATATDHAVLEPYTERLGDDRAEALFQRARRGEADAADQRAFEAHMLVEMARLSTEDGLVMQLHPGAYRDHNPLVAARFGPDKGADIPVATEYTRNLRALLAAHGNDPRLTLILFTLDETAYARELAPLAGHYPAVRLGAPWWFHDSAEGMRRFREQATETAGIYNTAGFVDDTRAFCSIPARHDLARRVDANWLAGLVARHVVDLGDARAMARALAVELAREAYKFGPPAGAGRPPRQALPLGTIR